MKFVYDRSVNKVVKPTLAAVLEEVSDLFPDWCSQVTVFWETNNPNGFLVACKPNYHYRFVQLVFFPSFLDDLESTVSLVHEIQHSIMTPYVDKAEEVINHFIEDGLVRQYIFTELRKAEEAVVQDLAKLVGKLDSKYGIK